MRRNGALACSSLKPLLLKSGRWRQAWSWRATLSAGVGDGFLSSFEFLFDVGGDALLFHFLTEEGLFASGLNLSVLGGYLRLDGSGVPVDDGIDFGFILGGIERQNQLAGLGFFGFGIGFDRQPGGKGSCLGFQSIEMLPGGLADRFLPLVLDVFPSVQPINRGPENQKGCSGPH
ncbi:MAG: hypothetical protein HY309_26965 [Pseudomonas fluorescens]|nr:hypothetical protein [Pseudomonas fluorescens]